MKSFVHVLDAVSTSPLIVDIWKLKDPPRVVAFAWLALFGCILTNDNIRKRNNILANGCPMCLNEVEFVDHLMVSCEFAHFLWFAVFQWFGLSWVSPSSLGSLF